MRPDIVIPCKPEEHNEELRFVLRSLANLPHGTVHIVGYAPTWVDRDTVNVIHRPRKGGKFSAVLGNIKAACMSEDVSDEFVLFNDDMYVMQKIKTVPVLNYGTVADRVARLRGLGNNSMYVQSMENTQKALEELGYRDILSFELHTPLPVQKRLMLAAIALKGCFRWNDRTAYGAVAGLTGKTVLDDVKVYFPDDPIPAGVFLSTADAALAPGRVLDHLRAAFPSPSRYERGAE